MRNFTVATAPATREPFLVGSNCTDTDGSDRLVAYIFVCVLARVSRTIPETVRQRAGAGQSTLISDTHLLLYHRGAPINSVFYLLSALPAHSLAYSCRRGLFYWVLLSRTDNRGGNNWSRSSREVLWNGLSWGSTLSTREHPSKAVTLFRDICSMRPTWPSTVPHLVFAFQVCFPFFDLCSYVERCCLAVLSSLSPNRTFIPNIT